MLSMQHLSGFLQDDLSAALAAGHRGEEQPLSPGLFSSSTPPDHHLPSPSLHMDFQSRGTNRKNCLKQTTSFHCTL